VTTPLVLKLGGELLEETERRTAIAAVIAAAGMPLVVVHGGGREIDAALARAGIQKRQVDGLRVTDAATMGIVVEILAGAVNTRFVAAINAAGGRSVGLTGADAGLVPVMRTPPMTAANGDTVDLGLVGQPIATSVPTLALDLVRAGYVPVIASVAASADGTLLNVNADTLASHLAARLLAPRLVIAGATPGVLDESGRTIPWLDGTAIDSLIASGVATAGMVAKLRACREALAAGVSEIVLVDGREASALATALRAPGAASLPATRMVA
jgi:acetylglutamate kinase